MVGSIQITSQSAQPETDVAQPNVTNPAPGAGSDSDIAATKNPDAPQPAYDDANLQSARADNPPDAELTEQEDSMGPENKMCGDTGPAGTQRRNPQDIRFSHPWQNHLVPQLWDVLESLQSYFNRELLIKSGWRCPAYNKQVGGARNSRHVFGQAADVSMHNFQRNSEWKEFIVQARILGAGGIGIYNSFIHIDVRPELVAWGSNGKSYTTPSWAKTALVTT